MRGACATRGWRSRALVWSVVVCVVPGLLAACGASATTPRPAGPTIPTVAIGAKDYRFDMPNQVPGGLVQFTMTNSGKEPHQANLARLRDGVTQQAFTAALQQGPDAALGMVDFVGGPNTIDPGMRQTVVVDLKRSGQYVALCFLTSPNGKSHIEEGMIKFFMVGAPSATQPAEPHAAGVVELQDFSITLPGAPSEDTTTWKVWNHGSQPHEMAVIKLAAGKTAADATAFLENPSPAGPPPFSDVGGIGALAPNVSGWVTLYMDKGNYVALCFVPDPKTGKAHFMLGMVTAFTVK